MDTCSASTFLQHRKLSQFFFLYFYPTNLKIVPAKLSSINLTKANKFFRFWMDYGLHCCYRIGPLLAMTFNIIDSFMDFGDDPDQTAPNKMWRTMTTVKEMKLNG